MRAVFYRSMRAIEHALSARREYLTKDGQIILLIFGRLAVAFRAGRITTHASLRRSTIVIS
jgi:hypothetical protein